MTTRPHPRTTRPHQRTDRPPITFVLLAGDDGSPGKQLLASMAVHGRRDDQLVMVGPGRRPDRVASWRVLQGGALARLRTERPPEVHPLVVLVDGRLEPHGDWVTPLASALADPAVAAVAPRTNLAAGDEVVAAVPYRPGETDVRARWARRLAVERRGQRTTAERLGGPCLALRRAVLEATGGLGALGEQEPDLAGLAAAALTATPGGTLVVAEDAFVHHPGGPPRHRLPSPAGGPLLSACLIVRDEADNLPRCLESIGGAVDEIVVYDTGSTDGTVPLARRLGARVVEGHWDDDFARARNDALAHCRGMWVLWVDADEALRCEEPAALRRSLAARPADVEGLLVLIDNLRGNEAGTVLTHPACRLFRRACGHWQGRLHEQVVARQGTTALALSVVDRELVHLTHWGYLQSALSSRDKAARNVRTAFADLAGISELDGPTRLVSLGRSHMLAGRYPEGVELCRQGAATASAPTTVRLALRNVIEGLLALGRPEEARREIRRLRARSTVHSLADLLDGRALLDLDDPAAALEALDRVRPGLDDDGFEYGPHDVAAPRAAALRALGRHGEAADALLGSIRATGGVDAHLGLLVECLEDAGRPLGEIFAALPADRVRAFVPQLLQLRPVVADRLAEAWLAAGPDQAGTQVLLAAAATLARELPVARQLVWSSRLRGLGLHGACPLLSSATEGHRAPRDRALAAAAAAAAFGDRRGHQAAGAAIAQCPAADRLQLRGELIALDPAFAAQVDALAPSPIERAGGAGPPRYPPGASPGGRRVLLVDDAPAGIRTAALARRLSGYGHRVTLVVPEPVGTVGNLLGPGVRVVEWLRPPASADAEPAVAPALRAVALTYAEQPFDVVVAARAARPLLADLRRLLPAARLVLDLDDEASAPDDELSPTPPTSADLLWWSGEAPEGTRPGRRVTWSASDVLPAPPPTPMAGRHGLCVVAPPPAPGGDERSWMLDLVAALAADARLPSLAVLGDDRDGAVARAAPLALRPGHLADPIPWLRTCRLVVVLRSPGASHWLAAAALCGTPSMLVDPARTGPIPELVGQVAAQLADGCGDASPAGDPLAGDPLAGDPLAGDPLAGDPLAGDRRRPARRAVATARAHRAGPVGTELADRAVVCWRGDVFARHSLATVNRELLRRLADPREAGRLRVWARTAEPEPTDPHLANPLAQVAVLGPHASPPHGTIDVEVRHQWPPDFTPSTARRLVLVQPWEYGGLPAEWIGPLRDVVDELWVPSSWVRRCAVDSGVPEEKVQVVPNGVDTDRFAPGPSSFPLATAKGTKLLFVGGCIPRKGIDVLLESYLATFSRKDDVCLVVKPFGSGSVYRGSSMEDMVRQAAAGAGAEIEVLDGELSDQQMADLYRSCDALVHPYRGEGFGLPIAEAMASGLPVVVPDGGACLDFCDDSVGWLVPSRQVPLGASEWTASRAGAWWLEPSRLALGEAMRAVVASPESRRRKGEAGRRRIVSGFTWDQVAARVTERLLALADVDRQEPHETEVPA
jgi:glycosyltransferase involved in cell wall biosynthesis